ncbi:MAG TPA: hypothetical protein VFJ15_05270 [Oleiagrimonas sp.]|nr:hypothetical protein [Oleiagrimonas sp.]
MNVVAKFLPRREEVDAERGLVAAAEWLARAQDVTGCGGVSAYYDAAKRRWAGAYPETTGYIIPTFFRYAELSGKDEYRDRALYMAAWESDIQLAGGGVRAGTLDAQSVEPTIFNTGQVLFGWLAAWRKTQDVHFRDSLVRAADWLAEAQDSDGAWRWFGSPFAKYAVNTYNTRVAFAMAEVGLALDKPRYVGVAMRNVQWALTQMHANGWLANNDLQDNDRPLTHTIAYATRGILEVGLLMRHDKFIDAAMRTAKAVADCQREDGFLPGRLDADWRPACHWSCMTGNAQMAIIWQRLAAETGDDRWRLAAERATGFVLRVQDPTTTRDGVRGGIPGSHPRRSEYMKHRYTNWAAKFTMDALMLQMDGRPHA